MIKHTILFLSLIFVTFDARAQSVTQSWLRQAGITCGGGLGYEAQGELDSTVLRKLKIIDFEGEGTFQQSDIEKLLEQFSDNEKGQTYNNYVSCLLNIMGLANAASNLPSREVILDSPLAIAELETIKRGQRFAMAPGETIALIDHSLIFSVNYVKEFQGQKYVYFSWSNSQSGEGKSNTYVAQSQLIDLRENCRLTPYQIILETKQVSFISNC